MYLIHLFPTPLSCMCIAKVHPSSSSSDSRQVQFSELQKVADENNAACIESSAKDDVNVGELLFLLVHIVHLSTFLWDWTIHRNGVSIVYTGNWTAFGWESSCTPCQSVPCTVMRWDRTGPGLPSWSSLRGGLSYPPTIPCNPMQSPHAYPWYPVPSPSPNPNPSSKPTWTTIDIGVFLYNATRSYCIRHRHRLSMFFLFRLFVPFFLLTVIKCHLFQGMISVSRVVGKQKYLHSTCVCDMWYVCMMYECILEPTT